MKWISTVKSGGGCSGADIANVEQRLGVRLPADYRAFLIEHNGCEFTDDSGEYVCPVIAWPFNPDFALRQLFGCVSRKNIDDIITRTAWLGDRLPNGVICIGEDYCANVLVMFTGSDELGAIRVREIHNESLGEPASAMYLVAPSFREFMLMIRQDRRDPDVA